MISAFQFTNAWCCDRHPGSGFHIRHFFDGRLLYQDADTLNLYYGSKNESDRELVPLPTKGKRKLAKKSRNSKDRQELVARLFNWRYIESSNDVLAVVRPASFIIDNKNIIKLSSIHPSELTNEAQVVVALNESQEWKSEWAMKIFDVIQTYDKELDTHRKTLVAKTKTNQKKAKIHQDHSKFEEDSNERAERIRQEVAARFKFSSSTTGMHSGPLKTLSPNSLHRITR